MGETLYRIVDQDGKIYAGYTNTLSLYRTYSQAYRFMVAEVARREARFKLWSERGGDPTPVPTLRIQKVNLAWEDV